LAKTRLKAYQIHHIGDVLKWERGDFVFKDSGFSVDIGPKNNDELAAQIKVAARFVKRHFSEIKRLRNVDKMRLDFGYCMLFDKTGEPFWVQQNIIPSEFMKVCGELKIEIVLAFYYGCTVDKLIRHYIEVLKLKHPKLKRKNK
jgi:hypothetical protein